MSLPGFRVQTFVLAASPASTQIASASSGRSRVMLSVQPGANFAAVSSDAGVTADVGVFISADSGPIEISAAEHGALAQVALFASGSGAGVRLTVVEVFGASVADGLGGPRA